MRHRPIPADARSPLRQNGLNQLDRVQQFQRAAVVRTVKSGDMQIARGGFRPGVSQQKLNLADIAASFEQMRGEGMSQRMRVDGFK